MTTPISPELVAIMNRVADTLAKVFKPYGFALLVFPMNEEINGRVNYISNAERDSMIVAMKEFIARHEGRVTESKGRH